MATTDAPRARARSTVRLVSVVVPDWLMATTSVSVMSAERWNPDSSVAVMARTMTPEPATATSMAAATAWPATAAVPWPITSTRRTEPIRPRSSGGRVSAGRFTPRVPPSSTRRPRSVLRNDWGASLISLSRKWGASPRSMSRVVTDGVFHSTSSMGRGVPS